MHFKAINRKNEKYKYNIKIVTYKSKPYNILNTQQPKYGN